MTRYAAFLASVNVGGNRVKMADLRKALEEAGFARVETVIASGNLLFDHAKASDEKLAARIAACVKAHFGFRTFAAVRSATDLKAGLEGNPFIGGNEHKFVYTWFLEKKITKAGFDALVAAHKGPEKLATGAHDLYIDYVDGAADSKLTARFLEKHLGCMGTGRNVRSIRRILDKMEA